MVAPSHAFLPLPHTHSMTIASAGRIVDLHKRKSPIVTHSSSSLYMAANGGNSGDANNGEAIDYDTMEPQVYPQRWVQLGYLSMLALMSDWICFSVAAAPQTYENSFGHSAASLIDMFLFMNVASCFLVTDIVAKVGLQRAIQGAGALMTLGCWFRCGFSFLVPVAQAVGLDATQLLASSSSSDSGLVPYPFIVVGTLMVGAAQPFFQCTPPLLSATWFGADERSTSTAVALNFNQIGIATAFLVGGAMATDPVGLEQYFGLVAILCTIVAIGTFLQFENLPPSPPSSSAMDKLKAGEAEPPFLESVQTLFATNGFTRPLAAFVCSIAITNIVGVSKLLLRIYYLGCHEVFLHYGFVLSHLDVISFIQTFIDDVMKRGGITEQFEIDLAGAGFEVAILLGGIVIGGYVDRTKEYKKVTMACIASSAALLIPLGLTEHQIGNEPILLILALFGLGMAAGPVQPINAELAVDVTYPGDETAVESVQQIGGNLMSALLVPIAEKAASMDYQILPKNPELASDIRGDVVLLTVIAGITLAYFSSFDAPLRRTIADCADNGGTCEIPPDDDVIDVPLTEAEKELLSR